MAALLDALLPLLLDRALPENRAAAAAEGAVDAFDTAPPPAADTQPGLDPACTAPSAGAGWAAGLAAVLKTLLGALGVLARGDLRTDPAYLHAAGALAHTLLHAASVPGKPRAALQVHFLVRSQPCLLLMYAR